MNLESSPLNPEDDTPPGAPLPQRLYLFEPGWRVSVKLGSERTYCYMMTPGQDYYHRLLAGEIYFHHADEKLCLGCARRRGLITHEPKILREPLLSLDLDLKPPDSEFNLAPGIDDEDR